MKKKFIFEVLLARREIMGHYFPILLMTSKRTDIPRYINAFDRT